MGQGASRDLPVLSSTYVLIHTCVQVKEEGLIIVQMSRSRQAPLAQSCPPQTAAQVLRNYLVCVSKPLLCTCMLSKQLLLL